ncbi:type III-B CRISPR module RAMP protein Cmr1 [Thermodesulfobium sp. 4217-1]|uniref:type III-B CRISPR module RAMP protein Cmr1 n=1 Tax=Thermodesulfobium sp. 4217-1 TaxID=3120013 RepID=UPI0032221B87
MKEIKVEFETITPVWTGDAWGESKEIRPSSLMGSLRFWFVVYWKTVKNGKTENLNSDNVVIDNLSELEDPKIGRTLNQILKNHLKNNNDDKSFDEMLDQSLKELGLPIPSRLFGFTGWKSRIEVKKIDSYEEKLRLNELDFNFPSSDSIKVNTKFWIKKNLFENNNSEIILFKNIKLLIRTTEYWQKKYLSDFF